MRAGVTLLDRWITIRANTTYHLQAAYKGPDDDPWGGRVLVTDFFDMKIDNFTTGSLVNTPVFRKGFASMDYVEIRNCSQRGTWRPAL